MTPLSESLFSVVKTGVSVSAAGSPSPWSHLPISEQIMRTVAQEFADLSDVTQATRIVVRLLLAAILGGLLGWQRESQGKAAGLRTHMLVAMGAAMFVAIPQLLGASVGDGSRVLQGVIAGVGFLGAGTILKSGSEGDEEVRGLTTAAGIWFTAAIGAAVGVGEESTAMICAVLAWLVLTVVPWITPTAASPRIEQDLDRVRKGEQATSLAHTDREGKEIKQ